MVQVDLTQTENGIPEHLQDIAFHLERCRYFVRYSEKKRCGCHVRQILHADNDQGIYLRISVDEDPVGRLGNLLFEGRFETPEGMSTAFHEFTDVERFLAFAQAGTGCPCRKKIFEENRARKVLEDSLKARVLERRLHRRESSLYLCPFWWVQGKDYFHVSA
jgi:hypothetical protein